MSVNVHFRLEDLLVEAPAGTSLQAIADAAGADITFGCRTGSCGTCRVRVVEGLQHCSEAGPEERDFLLGLDAPAEERLACQVCVHGDVAIEYLGL
jgi:ferredoxin